MAFPVELDVQSQEEFSFSDSTDDTREEPLIPSSAKYSYETYIQELAQLWRRSCDLFHEQWGKVRGGQRHIAITRTEKLAILISVILFITIWLARSVKRSEVDTSNSRPLWAKTRLEVGPRREKH